MIQRRIFVLHARCYQRWVWRNTPFDYVPRPLTEMKLGAPPHEVWKATSVASQIYATRKKPKKGTGLFKAAWYKSRGFRLV